MHSSVERLGASGSLGGPSNCNLVVRVEMNVMPLNLTRTFGVCNETTLLVHTERAQYATKCKITKFVA